ncbi:MAG: hypothetical protein ABSE64_15525 [Vulcanimicrobiaceae bacterium]|jgi:hypothetical protein
MSTLFEPVIVQIEPEERSRRRIVFPSECISVTFSEEGCRTVRLQRVCQSLSLPLLLAAMFARCLAPTPVNADIISDVSGAIGSLTVGGIMSQIQTTGSNLINQASSNGSMLEFQAGNQMNILLANSNDLLTSQSNTVFGQLSHDEQVALATAWQASQTAQNAAYANAWLLQNVTVVDVSGLENNLPFVTQQPIFVQAVAGTVMVQGGSYQLVVVGSHMGLTDNTDRTTYSLKVNGQDVPLVASSVRRNVESLSLASASIDRLFAAKAAIFADAVLTIHNDHLYPRQFFNKGGWGHTDLAVPLKLALYSLDAGTVTVRYTRPVYGWADIGWAFSTGYMALTGNCAGHPSPPCQVSASWGTGGGGTTSPSLNDVIFTTWQVQGCQSANNTCGWSQGSGCNIQNNGTTLNCMEQTTSYPVQLDFGAKESKYEIVGDSDTVITQDVNYGQPFKVSVPKDTSRVEISGTISIGGANGTFDLPAPLAGSIFGVPITSVPSDVITYTWPTSRPDSGFALASLVGN